MFYGSLKLFVCVRIRFVYFLFNGCVIVVVHSFITICKAHYVKSEVLEAVARWSVIGKVASF